jgi:hypothetical protein
MSEANGTSTEVGERVATAIFKAKGWPGVVMLDIKELAIALEYAIDIYSGNIAKVRGLATPLTPRDPKNER